MLSMAAAERSQQVQTGIQLVVDALLGAVADKDLQVPDLAALLSAAYTARNRLDHALTLAVGAFDDRAQQSHDEVKTLDLEPKHHTKLNQGWRLERLPNGRMKVHPPGRQSSSPRLGGGGPPGSAGVSPRRGELPLAPGVPSNHGPDAALR